MKTLKQWSITFKNVQSDITETDYFYNLTEFMTALNKIASDKNKYYIKSDYNSHYKPNK